MKMNNKMRKQSGFTLIELALVIAGLAIISFGAFVVSGGVLDNARISSMTNQIQSTKTAVELSKLHTGCTPTSLEFLVDNDQAHSSCTGTGSLDSWKGPYIQNANIQAGGDFELDNIAENTVIRLQADGGASGTDVYIETETNATIGQGVLDNLCPGNNTTALAGGVGDLDAQTPCGFITANTNQVFWVSAQ